MCIQMYIDTGKLMTTGSKSALKQWHFLITQRGYSWSYVSAKIRNKTAKKYKYVFTDCLNSIFFRYYPLTTAILEWPGKDASMATVHSNDTHAHFIYTDDPLAYIRRYIDDILE